MAERAFVSATDLAVKPAAAPGKPGQVYRRPWQLPAQGLAVFHGPGETARLSHYFLPRLLLQGKPVLVLDGANCADPRLLERLARERGVPFEHFNRQVRIARAFTCFQLTELIARVPRWLEGFPAPVLIVTALPELYYDEDVRDWDARVAFEQALADLRRWAERSLTVAVFSAAPTFRPPAAARRRFFAQTCAAATEVWEFRVGGDRRLILSCAGSEKSGVRSQKEIRDAHQVPLPRAEGFLSQNKKHKFEPGSYSGS